MKVNESDRHPRHIRANGSSAPTTRESTGSESSELTEAQAEFLEDLRVSLIQMKNGDVMPAREALRQIEREYKCET
ncbi:MAG: hypothetical protein OXI34_06135 [Chloroflexota bacterium]|nr:hypothetical protein [Chloroflexota bacterium]MDE2945683.1 hypothetical protein [Chloroflexota bacterium]